MNDRDCVRFLQQALPRLQLRWPGFRRVRRQVCKRLQRRLKQLQLPGLDDYRQYLEQHPVEWDVLDGCCRITISRFYRDRGVFRVLEQEVLPLLAREARQDGRTHVRIWSAGCGAGEEPYSLAILWAHAEETALRHVGPDIVATDIDPALLQRANLGCYAYSSVRELPPAWRNAAFSRNNGLYCLHPAYRHAVRFSEHDIRSAPPHGPFDLVLCRNLAFTYFDDALQQKTGRHIASVLRSGGLLVLGAHERLPDSVEGFVRWRRELPLYRRQS